ncbi:MAG: hypothetical protein EHM40_04150 [Chloroflexi bacterium]|nr:MAG: hypothetical protein EHM40_04150 [Chloroflexota bacterium]
MFAENLCFFERLSDKFKENNNRSITLAIWVLVFILLFTLMSFALVEVEEVLEYDDIFLMGDVTASWPMEYPSPKSLPLGLELGVLMTIMRLEYLRSHIGEKRSASSVMNGSNLSLFARFSKTALFYSAVFFVLLALFVDDVNRLTKVFHSRLIYPILSKERFLIHGGILVMSRMVQSSLFAEKLLIHGGL